MTEVDEYMEQLNRFMLSCHVRMPLTVFWYATTKQKQALNTLLHNYRASEARLTWSFSNSFLEGQLTTDKGATTIYFGISEEGEVHT